MKNVRKILLGLFLVMTSTTCFVACQDEEDALMTTNKTLTDPTTENRFLTFSTFSDLQNLIDTLQSMDSADLVHWNKDNNFISLYINLTL